MMLNAISKSIGKLKEMKERSRDEAIKYVNEGTNNKDDVIKKIDSFLEYFTIMPVDLDPAGVINKLDHLMTTRDERMRTEIKNMLPKLDSVKANSVENVIEIATSYNMIYKIARHFYLIGKKSSNIANDYAFYINASRGFDKSYEYVQGKSTNWRFNRSNDCR